VTPELLKLSTVIMMHVARTLLDQWSQSITFHILCPLGYTKSFLCMVHNSKTNNSEKLFWNAKNAKAPTSLFSNISIELFLFLLRKNLDSFTVHLKSFTTVFRMKFYVKHYDSKCFIDQFPLCITWFYKGFKQSHLVLSLRPYLLNGSSKNLEKLVGT